MRKTERVMVVRVTCAVVSHVLTPLQEGKKCIPGMDPKQNTLIVVSRKYSTNYFLIRRITQVRRLFEQILNVLQTSSLEEK